MRKRRVLDRLRPRACASETLQTVIFRGSGGAADRRRLSQVRRGPRVNIDFRARREWLITSSESRPPPATAIILSIKSSLISREPNGLASLIRMAIESQLLAGKHPRSAPRGLSRRRDRRCRKCRGRRRDRRTDRNFRRPEDGPVPRTAFLRLARLRGISSADSSHQSVFALHLPYLLLRDQRHRQALARISIPSNVAT